MSRPTRARASAPGKLMLFGEYAVLHGWTAVSCAFSARIAVQAEARDDGRVYIDSPRIQARPLEVDIGALDGPVVPGLAFVWECLRACRTGLAGGVGLRIDAGFPREWGLGSSSAVTVATLGALEALAGHEVRPLDVARRAIAVVRAAQGGVGSGTDAANQAVGGLVRYRMEGGAGGGPEIDPLPLQALDGVGLYAVWTGMKASTTAMIAGVSRHRPPGDPLFTEMGRLAEQAAYALAQGDVSQLGAWFDAGLDQHRRLDTLSPDLWERLQRLRRCTGVAGVKPTGAGGGDTVLLLAGTRASARRAAEDVGMDLLPVDPEARGLRLEDPT